MKRQFPNPRMTPLVQRQRKRLDCPMECALACLEMAQAFCSSRVCPDSDLANPRPRVRQFTWARYQTRKGVPTDNLIVTNGFSSPHNSYIEPTTTIVSCSQFSVASVKQTRVGSLLYHACRAWRDYHGWAVRLRDGEGREPPSNSLSLPVRPSDRPMSPFSHTRGRDQAGPPSPSPWKAARHLAIFGPPRLGSPSAMITPFTR